MASLVIKCARQLRHHIAAFSDNVRGLAAVEFAMILPLMLVTFFGVIGTTSAISIDRKVTLIARTLSDLTSQNDNVTDTDIQNFFAIGNAMMTPYKATVNPFSGGPLKAVITEVYVNPSNGEARVKWSKANGAGTAMTVNDLVSMPADLIGKDASNKVLPNQYFILSQVSYNYAPSILPGIATVELKESTYTRPRVTMSYACVRMNGVTPCPK
ncbi:MAG: TadE/TadG family type IV pilus assembly protein [Xanthobacteraceae bacterium]